MSDVDTAGSDTETSTTESQTESTTNTESTVLTGDQQTQAEGSETDTAQQSSDSESGDEQAGDTQIEYQFTAPEGVELDAAMVEAATPVFKELGLTQEQADKLVDVYANHMDKQVQASQDAYSKQLNDWRSELQQDKSFGGDKFDENSAMVAQFIDKTVPAEVRDDVFGLLTSTGAGNHPGLVKYFHSLATRFPVGEDRSGSGSAGASASSKDTFDSVLQKLYPNETTG